MRVLAVLALLGAAPLAVAGAAMLEHVEVSTDPAPRVTLTLSEPATPMRHALAPAGALPARFYVDLAGVTLGPEARATVAGAGPVLQVRTGQFDPSTARVVVDLASAVPLTVRVAGQTVTIEVEPGAAVVQPPVAAAPPSVTARTRVVTPPPPVASGPGPPRPLAPVPPSVVAPTPPPPARVEPSPVAAAPAPSPRPERPPVISEPGTALVQRPVAAAPPSVTARTRVVTPPPPVASGPGPPRPLAPVPPSVVAPTPPPPARADPSPVAAAPAPSPRPERPPVTSAPSSPPPIAAVTPLPPSPPPAPAVPVSNRTTLVVVDAGHGGRDPGAAGIGGILEKDIVLEFARLLAAKLSERLPVDTLLTRSDDSFVPLIDRLPLPDSRATLFLSLHANACSDPALRGVEVFYGGGQLRRVTTSAPASPRAVLLARLLASALRAQLGSVREPRPGPFTVLTRNPVPSALIEIGYLTHREDAERAQNLAYREALTDALVTGVESFLHATAPRL